MNPCRLWIRLDAGAGIGFGHAVRVAGLLNHLRTPLGLTVVGGDAGLARFFPGARLLPLPPGDAWWETALAEQADALLVDLPAAAHRPWRSFRRGGVPVMAIDDEGGEVEADLIINGTVAESCHRYPGQDGRAEILAGARYALIRPEFAATPWLPQTDRSLIAVIGSGQRAADWAFLLLAEYLPRMGLDRVTLVVGAAFPELERLRGQAQRLGVTLRQGLAAAELARELAGHALALATGGMIVYEALACGVPLAAFPQVDNMLAEMAWFEAAGCLTNLGYDGGMAADVVVNEASALLERPELALQRSARGRGIVDGRGMARVAAAMEQLLRVRPI